MKGAYVEDSTRAHPWGPETNRAYAQLARALPDAALATHDPALLAALPHRRVEHLLGVRSRQASDLAASGREVRIYVPYGANWFRYFMRRRAEAQGS